MSYPYQQYPPEGYQGAPNPRYQQQMPSFDVHLQEPGPALPQQYLHHGSYMGANQYQYAQIPPNYNFHNPLHHPTPPAPPPPPRLQQSYPSMYFQSEYRPHATQTLPNPNPLPMPYSMPHPMSHSMPQPIAAPLPTKPSISTSQSPNMGTIVKPKKESIEDQTQVLLALSDEYYHAAQKKPPSMGEGRSSQSSGRYFEYMSLCIGCLETAINLRKMSPKAEAQARLKYASILNDNTENSAQAEMALTKGIALCERNRFLYLKYNMQHLLIRVMCSKSRKAALKALDSNIKDVEAYRHTSWIYAFRFLRASLTLDSSGQNDVLAALGQYRSISKIASSRGDTAIFVTSAVLEAQAHLMSHQDDSIEQAQRSLAMARSRQLDEAVTSSMPQITALAQVLDLTCSLEEGNVSQALPKVQTLHELLDRGWRIDAKGETSSSFVLPIQSSSGQTSSSENIPGVITSSSDGFECIEIDWISRKDVYILSYLLSGVTYNHTNSRPGHKAENFFLEGLRTLNNEVLDLPTESKSLSSSRIQWRSTVSYYLHLHLAFALCARADWESARDRLKNAEKSIELIGESAATILRTLVLYMSGTLDQATGRLDAALQVFERPEFALPQYGSNTMSRPETDISILATLNSILMLRDPSHPQHGSTDSLIDAVEPFCQSHPNKNIQAAFYLIKATAHPDDTIIKTKQYLHHSLQAAKKALNGQLTGVILNFMCYRFFTGVVGDQAEKSARAGLKLARREGNPLWVSVAEGMLSDTLEVQGRREEAAAARDTALSYSAQFVPELHEAQTTAAFMANGQLPRSS